ncbi:hypothetical protein [Nocardiopsis sp. CC223A]|uniref:hypothetical protein n=1 Tax=Nocardiopsis sp. CC223A TaxID=3044051 RepID=UPI00278C05ED|nr:hypothetical protein [Nocardiopsis sp. CC223A]
MSLAVTLIGAALFLLGLLAALALEAWIIRKDRAVAGEPVEGMAALLLRTVPLPRSCVRIYLAVAAMCVLGLTTGYPAVAAPAAVVACGSPSVDRRLRRLRSGRGPTGRREPRPLSSRTLADRGRRMAGAVLLALLAAATVVLAAAAGGWPAVAAIVVLAAAAGAVAQGLLLPRIVLDGTHLYLYGGRRTTVVPVDRVAGVESGDRGITVRLTDGTGVSSTTWARTPGHRHRIAARVRDFVARTRPAADGIEGRRPAWERAFPLDLCFVWICAGLVALRFL